MLMTSSITPIIVEVCGLRHQRATPKEKVNVKESQIGSSKHVSNLSFCSFNRTKQKNFSASQTAPKGTQISL